jgi:hypothetical protein
VTQQKHRGGWKREQRYLYALLFPGRRCYIGQTTRPQQRWSEHRRAWHEPFKPLLLGSVVGTYDDAVDYEHAWRYQAHNQGFHVLGEAGAEYFVSPWRQMDARRYEIARHCRWPRPWWHRLAQIIAAILALLIALALVR